MKKILRQIELERLFQDEKWGEQNHPILYPPLIDWNPSAMCTYYQIPSEDRAKRNCDINHKRGRGTYMHILVEEVSEAASCGRDMKKLRAELIQVAATAVAMIEAIDRKEKYIQP